MRSGRLVGFTLFAAATALVLLLTCMVMFRRPRQPAEGPDAEEHFRAAATRAATASRAFLEWMDAATERLAPERAVDLAQEVRRLHAEPLHAARADLDAHPPPAALQPFAATLSDGFDHVTQAFDHMAALDAGPFMRAIGDVLAAWHHAARAQEIFYSERVQFPPFAGYWQIAGTDMPDMPAHPAGDAQPQTGIIHVDPSGHHGGFSVYVPETYSADRAWPVIMALHGASGNGRDFLWMWLREAKSFGYLLVAPTSVGPTWSDIEDVGLLEILSWLDRRYRVASRRVLLTGLSDGGTYALLYGLAHPDMYRALAPLCGVLHPANEGLGNLRRARGIPIYMVHGARDFLFPVQSARVGRDVLLAAGAAVEYRELPELSHTYPRSENVRILRWFAALTTP